MLLKEGDRDNPEIIWKAEINTKQEYNLIILLKNQHFDVITNLPLYFYGPKMKYCIDCEFSYKNRLEHRNKCIGINI